MIQRPSEEEKEGYDRMIKGAVSIVTDHPLTDRQAFALGQLIGIAQRFKDKIILGSP